MGVSLLRGRFFSARDDTNAASVVIINEALARRYFSGSNPIGKRIASPDFGPHPCEIVGIIKDLRQASMDAAPRPEVFRPLLQECFFGITIVARSRSAPDQTFAAMRREVASVDRNLPVSNARTMNQLLSESLAPRRFALLLMGSFAALALVLSLVGIYGVLSRVVNGRTREIGIRLAIGAQRRDVLGMILMRGMRPVVIGGLLGLAGACALTRFMRSLLYEVSPTDPFTLAVVALLVGTVALLACWLPARRASKVEPMVALRSE